MCSVLLSYGFGIKGYDVSAVFRSEEGLVIQIEQPRKTLCCSACGSGKVISKGTISRQFQAVPIGRMPVTIDFAVPRVRCSQCGLERQVKIPFADAKKGYTKGFERYVLDLLRFMTINGVATHLGVGWDLVKQIQKENLHHWFARPKLKHLKRIAIDEIYVGKKHKYLTIVLDLDSGAIVYVGKGKGEAALDNFWIRLRASHARIEAVAADLSPAYSAAIRKNLPRATLVFDRFHLVKLLNEHLTALRRELYNEATDLLKKSVLKGIRWLLLKSNKNLNDNSNERQRLLEGLKLNESLAIAYYLKEDLSQVWEQDHWLAGREFLQDWIKRAEASGIRQLQKFAKTLRTHQEGILAWYNHPISTGPLEGTNNKIKLMQRQAYGYKDLEFFKLKLLALHFAKHELVG